uniref:Secreted protein n=1 Tax=Panagrellus redivivus TaxID=6233 RepID=A0A7E4W0P3_PANRE
MRLRRLIRRSSTEPSFVVDSHSQFFTFSQTMMMMATGWLRSNCNIFACAFEFDTLGQLDVWELLGFGWSFGFEGTLVIWSTVDIQGCDPSPISPFLVSHVCQTRQKPAQQYDYYYEKAYCLPQSICSSHRDPSFVFNRQQNPTSYKPAQTYAFQFQSKTIAQCPPHPLPFMVAINRGIKA